jgi:hypothetical protein
MVGTRGTTNEITTIIMQCRALNLKKVKPDANSKLAFAFVDELKSAPAFFETNGTQADNLPDVEESTLTFTFDVTVKLKRPLKL